MKKVYLVAVVVALIAGICTFLFANQLFKTVSAKSADTTKVWVPKVDIEPNKMLDSQTVSTNFEQRDIFTKDLIENVVLDQKDLVGKVTDEKLYAFEQINRNRLTDENAENAALSLKLKENEVAYTIKATERQGVDGYINVGDTVDLLYIPTDVEKLKKMINGDDDELSGSGDSNSGDTDSSKSSKKGKEFDVKEFLKEYTNDKGERLIGNRIKLTTKDFLKIVGIEKVPNLEVLKISDHTSDSASEESGGQVTNYANITLRVSKEQAELLKQIEISFGADSYTLALNRRAN